MTDFALMVLYGRLTGDPVITQTKEGRTVCRFSIATNRRRGQEETTSYIPVTVFGDQGEICGKYLSKGRGVLVEGRFETDKYVDKNGIKRTGFGVVANDVTFGSGGRREEQEEDEEHTEEALPVQRIMHTAGKQRIRNEQIWRNRHKS
jgi:single-strand DNA-binding protein